MTGNKLDRIPPLMPPTTADAPMVPHVSVVERNARTRIDKTSTNTETVAVASAIHLANPAVANDAVADATDDACESAVGTHQGRRVHVPEINF